MTAVTSSAISELIASEFVWGEDGPVIARRSEGEGDVIFALLFRGVELVLNKRCDSYKC